MLWWQTQGDGFRGIPNRGEQCGLKGGKAVPRFGDRDMLAGRDGGLESVKGHWINRAKTNVEGTQTMSATKRLNRSVSACLGLLAAALLAVGSPGAAQAQDTDATANYRVTFTGTWTADKITQSSLPGGAHFTTLIGATHNSQVTFWEVGGTATSGVEVVAETGGTGTFTSEITSAGGSVGTRLQFSACCGPRPTTTLNFQANKSHPLVTLISMVAPTPDWFVGVSGLSLLDAQNRWRTSFSVNLHPYDAGTEDGNGFSLNNSNTSPRGTITSIRNTSPFNGQPLATLTFTLLSPTASFASASSSASEGAGARNVAVGLSPAPSSAITLNYSVGGSATSGADYAALPGTVSVSAGATSVNIPVTIIDDSLYEGAETLVLTLTGGTGYTVGSRSVHTLTITENDPPPPTANFASASSSAGEGAGTRNVAVSLSPAAPSAITLSYAVSGMATADADYAALPGTVSVSMGATSVNIPVTIIDDDDDEGAEAVVLTLTGGTGYRVGSRRVHMLTITDNDDPPPNTPVVSVSRASAAANEGSTASFTLTANPRPSASIRVRVNVAQTGSFAASGQTGDRSVQIGTGGTATLTVRTVNDSTDEPDGMLMVTVLGGTGYSPHDSQAVASVTVRDDDNPRPVDPPPPPPGTGGGGGGSGGGGGGGGGGAVSQRPEVAEELEARALSSGAALMLDLADAFRSPSGSSLTLTATSSEPTVAAVSVEGTTLTIRGLRPGETEVRVTATDGSRRSISQRFVVTVMAPEAVWRLPPASDPFLQGFVRLVNHSGQAGEVTVTATDAAGREHEPLTLRLEAHAVVHFNSADLENGNEGKGLSGGTGPGTGAWRLEFGGGTLDLEALGYLRSADGFLTAMGATAGDADGALQLLTFNPASNTNQVSRLRLINPTGAQARATVTGTDDAGESPGSPVVLTLPAGSACEVDAAELESGRGLACGEPQAGLGDGTGKWRLSVASEAPLVAMGLLSSPGGHLTNLSGTLPEGEGGVRRVAFFPPASDPHGRQGFVRVVNRSGRAGTVTIRAFDDSDVRYPLLRLRLEAGEAKHLNSNDLELGNARKGLSGSTGSGTGAWRLELSSLDIDFEAGSYVRHADGFLTAMQAVAPSMGGVHRVATFNPGSNTRQASILRLVNSGSEAAVASVTGADDRGVRPGGTVEVRVPAGAAVELTASELESGEADAIAAVALGDGTGKWRLRVASEGELAVMSLLSSPMGRLANLSGVDALRGVPPLPSLLPPPASVAVEDAGGRRVRGEWSAVAGARYGVDLLLDGAPVEGRSLARTTRTSFRWSGLAPGTYALRVRSVDADGQAGPWSGASNEVVIK